MSCKGKCSTSCSGSCAGSCISGCSNQCTSCSGTCKGTATKPSTNTSDNNKPSKPSPPPSINGIDKDKINSGTVVIVPKDGKEYTKEDMPLYNGAFYDPSTGQILSDYHGPNGIFDQSEWTTEWKRQPDGTVVGYFIEKDKKISYGSGGSSGGGSSYTPPPRPPKLDFTTPFPIFHSDVKEVTKYFYHFGIDEATFSKVKYEDVSVFVSPIIDLGTLYEKDYIMLEASFEEGDYTGFEFSILDNKKEHAILPYDVESVIHEQIFDQLPLRFKRDINKDPIIKQSGHIISSNLETLRNELIPSISPSYKDSYLPFTVSYTPLDAWQHIPSSRFVQIKVILRKYKGSITMPILKSMALRKYSENAPWLNKE